ncbi:hypothetical protein BKA63DRAFT_103201 [Paraphoma chrysanthemicola]|nr:hypothetical protein BKA63DRAFT_103201 [Paraphoma chrysanthemicola]
MSVCLNEAMRIFPAVPLGLTRTTNNGPATPTVAHSILPSTRVSVHQLGAYHSPLSIRLPESVSAQSVSLGDIGVGLPGNTLHIRARFLSSCIA